MAPQNDSDFDGILRALGRLEGRVDLLISNHLPHIHMEVQAGRKLTMWVGSVLAMLLIAMGGLLVRVLIG